MKKIKLAALLALVLLSCAILAISVRAYDDANPPPQNPYAWAEDENGNMADIFQLGDKIIIKAMSSHTPFTINLTDPDGTLAHTWTSSTTWFSSGVITDGTNKLGKWTISVEDYETKIAIGEYNVIPVVAFGALGALAACFAGFKLASFKTRKP